MTVEELVQRLTEIGAYAVIQKGRISVQIERNGRNLSDGWFNGPVSEIEATLVQAETRAAQQNPADIEYLSWGWAA